MGALGLGFGVESLKSGIRVQGVGLSIEALRICCSM